MIKFSRSQRVKYWPCSTDHRDFERQGDSKLVLARNRPTILLHILQLSSQHYCVCTAATTHITSRGGIGYTCSQPLRQLEQTLTFWHPFCKARWKCHSRRSGRWDHPYDEAWGHHVHAAKIKRKLRLVVGQALFQVTKVVTQVAPKWRFLSCI